MRPPAVVVVAYNRPEALARLLRSIDRSVYHDGLVPLVISIDRGPDGVNDAVAALARGFEWVHGPKQVIERHERLGVAGHFRAAGDLTAEYGDIVLLEDDLFVAPPHYAFARRALESYGDDERIAGVCLYGLSFNGFTHDPFLPIDDGGDVFFLGVPYTQGLAFTSAQWKRFEQHLLAQSGDTYGLHPSFARFGPDEWFPALAGFLATTDGYFCYPRTSMTTGWGDAGAHFESPSSWFQTPVQVAGESFRLPGLDESLAVYDGFYEILPDRLVRLGADLSDGDFDVDLYATKQRGHLRSGRVLTTRPVRRATASFGLRMYPPELNVVNAVPGSEISLAAVEDVDWGRWAGLEARRRLESYFWARHRHSRRRNLAFRTARIVEKWRASRREHDGDQGPP